MSFIKDLVHKKLTEVYLGHHFIERMEDRVWGHKEPNPASINVAAWANEDKYPKEVVQTPNLGKIAVPVTNTAKSILDNINFLQSEINFDTKRAIGIIFWKSSKTESGGKGWGDTLVGVYRHVGGGDCNDCMAALQWQPAKDVYGGRVFNTEIIIKFEDLRNYVNSTGIKNITDKDINNITKKEKNISSDKPEEIIIPINGVKYAIDYKNGKLYPKNKLSAYINHQLKDSDLINLDLVFDKLSTDIQDKILINMDALV